MQFRQVGRRIQVLAPMWDSEAKRTRQKLVFSFPADDPPTVHSADIKAIDGLDRDAAATEINEWNEARRKEIQDERSKNVTSINAGFIQVYDSRYQQSTIDAEGWLMGARLYDDKTSVFINRNKNAGGNSISAFIYIENGKDNVEIAVTDSVKPAFIKNNVKILDAIEECNALIEAFEG